MAQIAKGTTAKASNKAPCISVILTTYNRAAMVSKAIESVLAQTLTDFEFIIVDDGSTDTTAQALEVFAKRDKRIKIIHQKNQGLALSRNRAASQARGEYLTFVDDDDLCSKYRLEVQLELLRQHPNYDATSSFPVEITRYEEFATKSKPTGFPLHFNTAPVFVAPFKGILSQSTMLSRASFLGVGGYRSQATIIEDMDFTLRYSAKYKWLWTEQSPLYFYNYGLARSSSSLAVGKVFALRHIACWVSEWQRHQGLADPVEEGKSLKEIVALGKKLPAAARIQIYHSMEHIGKDSLWRDCQIRHALGYPAALTTDQRNFLYKLDRRLFGSLVVRCYKRFMKRESS